MEAENAIHELRESAERLIQRSQEMAEESLRLKRRADDLAQLFARMVLRGKNLADPFKLVIVRDLWLTRFDVPPPHDVPRQAAGRAHGTA